MANNENLKPGNNQLSLEEAQKNGAKGGKKKAENNKARKTYKEQLEIVIAIGQDKALKEAKKAGNKEAIKMIEEGGLIAYEHLEIALNNKIKPETRLKALDMIVDREEGKPKQSTDLIVKEELPLHDNEKMRKIKERLGDEDFKAEYYQQPQGESKTTTD